MSRYQSAYSNAELLEQRYIKECGECGVDTIVTRFLDYAPTLDATTFRNIRDKVREVLKQLNDFEAAQWAAALVENEDFETWLTNQS